MVGRVEVKPELLRWAAQRARLGEAALTRRVPQFPIWESLQAAPTLKQLEHFARVTHTPIGYLFLAEPPVEQVPIPDFRTISVGQPSRPSADLLDTVYLCQQRQDWYREFARSAGEPLVQFVGSARVTDDVRATAERMRGALGFDLDARRQAPTWTEALRHFIAEADALGVLVMVSGVVGSNNRRKLNPEEFRGLALVDPIAPLVFINGADTKAAQMFTVAHELAHVWLGESAVSDAALDQTPTHNVERWCNEVAAELLVPLASVRSDFRPHLDLAGEVTRLAARFKVSTLVVLRRLRDAGLLATAEYWQAYQTEIERLRGLGKSGGGDFYLTLAARVSKRFARALVVSTLEGRSSFTEAFRLLGFRKMATFNDLARSLGAYA
jgi:Zn-dependent peptidase ImmA (M78 family)